MKKIVIISLIISVLSSCNSTSNKTDCGEFWYIPTDNSDLGHILLSNKDYINTITHNKHFYIHIAKYLPIDKNSYYFGTATINNDTLYLSYKDKSKFRLSFDLTDEINAKSTFCNLYFYCNKVPKVVCFEKTPVDSIKGILHFDTRLDN